MAAAAEPFIFATAPFLGLNLWCLLAAPTMHEETASFKVEGGNKIHAFDSFSK